MMNQKDFEKMAEEYGGVIRGLIEGEDPDLRFILVLATPNCAEEDRVLSTIGTNFGMKETTINVLETIIEQYRKDEKAD